MVRIYVIDGGPAGEEAAFEADLKEEVTIVEQRPHLEPPWKSWLEPISRSRAKRDTLVFGGDHPCAC